MKLTISLEQKTTAVTTLIALLASFAMVLTPATAQETPEIQLDPTFGVVGASVNVTGTGFIAPGKVAIFIKEVGGDPIVVTDVLNRNGDIDVDFEVPNLSVGSYNVLACSYSVPTGECLGSLADAPFQVVAPTTTTSTTSPQTTTTTGVGILSTTTSSLVLGSPTTTNPDPPGPTGPTGVAFTTTSTSLDLPQGFADTNDSHFPDIEITAVEITQGIQDLQNRMPLIAGKRTMARVYVAADKLETEGIGGVVDQPPDEVIGAEGWEPVDGLLYLQRGGEELVLYANNAPITAFREGSDRLSPNETLNFDIPEEWTHGEVEITAFVWSFLPETIITMEDDAGNNFADGTVVFNEATSPYTIWFRLDGGAFSELSPTSYANALEVATESYVTYHPVAVPDFVVVDLVLGPGPTIGSEETPEEWDFVENRSIPLNRMRWVYSTWGFGDLTRMHGLIPSGIPSDGGGLTSWTSLTAWSKPTATTPAHEAAHMYFIKHAPCEDDDGDGIPDEVGGGGWGWIDQTYPSGLPSCSIAPEDPAGYYGTNFFQGAVAIYSNDQAVPNTRYPFMGYEEGKWIDAYHYCLLMETYEVGCNPASIGLTPKSPPGPPVDCGPAQGQDIVLDLCLWNGLPPVQPQGGGQVEVGGLALAVSEEEAPFFLLVDVDLGEMSLGHAMILDATSHMESQFDFIVERAKTGELANDVMLRVTDAAGHVLAQVPISNNLAGHSDVDTASATVELVPWYENAASLDLVANDLVVDSKQPSGAPVVEIQPVETSGSREFDVSWTATDPDGDSLLFTVFWSNDGGTTWRGVDTGYTEPMAKITSSHGLPGGDVLIQVTASDGLTTSSAITGPIEVPEGTPTGVLVAPESAPQYTPEQMTFHASDPEDGVIGSGSWTSSIDGGLGEGRLMPMGGLSAGIHEIVVEVADSSDNVTVLVTQLEIIPDVLPEPRVEGSVPDAETIARLGPENLDQFELGLDSPEQSTDEDPVAPAPGYLSWLITAGAVALVGGGLTLWRWMRSRSEA